MEASCFSVSQKGHLVNPLCDEAATKDRLSSIVGWFLSSLRVETWLAFLLSAHFMPRPCQLEVLATGTEEGLDTSMRTLAEGSRQMVLMQLTMMSTILPM